MRPGFQPEKKHKNKHKRTQIGHYNKKKYEQGKK